MTMARVVPRPHVLLVPSPSHGHTIPFINLSKKLASQGMSVTFVSSDKHIASLEHAKGSQDADGLDIKFVGLPGGPATFVDLFDEENDRKMAAMLSDLIEKLVRKSDGEVQGLKAVSAPPCCIISDMFGGWTHAVAKKFHICSHVLFTSPAACASMQLQIPKFIAEGFLPFPTSNKKSFVSIPGIPALNPLDLPNDLIQEESTMKYKFYTRNTLKLSDATCILINTFYELEKSVFDVISTEILNPDMQLKSLIPIGPLLPVEHSIEPEERHPCEKWLDIQKDESVLYVAFGTGVFFSEEQILELVQGLVASEQPFVLVLQLPKSDMATNFHYFPPGFEEKIQGHGQIVTTWAPQVRILNHPATGAFMTHCGWNSSLESVAAGVPMIAWPMMAEQKMNCRFLVDSAKLAIEVRRSEDGVVRKAEVERVVRLMMQESLGSDIHKLAKRMKDLAHKAVAPEGSSQKNVEKFIKEIMVFKSSYNGVSQ